MRHPFEVAQRSAAPRAPRVAPAWIALSFALLLSALLSVTVARTLFAGGTDELMLGGSGGDSIGSLPLNAPAGSSTSVGELGGAGAATAIGPQRPSMVLIGREADLLAVLLDATPASIDANYDVHALADGRLRLEFYGQLSLLLDRERLMNTPVTAQIRIGSTFLGGVATLSVGGEARSVQALPLGYLPLPLQQLSSSGVLPLGLSWRAQSLGGLTRTLDVHQAGSVIHVVQHD